MGNQQSEIHYLSPKIKELELSALRNFGGCDDQMTKVLNEELAKILKSVIPENVKLPMDVLSDSTIDPKIRNHVKAVLLDKINYTDLSNDVRLRFHQGSLMAALTCLYGNNWILDKKTFEASDYTKSFFTLTDNLSVGEWGSIFKGERGGMPFVIRTQNSGVNGERALHECFVAMRWLNQLRSICPNFSVILGSFVCGDPDSITGRYCTGPHPVQYLIYEYVPGKTFYNHVDGLRSVLKQLSPIEATSIVNDTVSMLFQIIMSLRYAQRYCQFSHRDLHGGNIIMRPLNQEAWIPYDSALFEPDSYLQSSPPNHHKIFYVRSRFVATVIDYETSEIFVPLTNPGNPSSPILTQFGIDDRNSAEKSVPVNPMISAMRDGLKIFLSTIMAVGSSIQFPHAVKVALVDTFIEYLWPENLNQSYDSKFEFIRATYRTGDYGMRQRQIDGLKRGELGSLKLLSLFLKHLPADFKGTLIMEHEINQTNQPALENEIVRKTGIFIMRSDRSISGAQELQVILRPDPVDNFVSNPRQLHETYQSYKYFNANSPPGVQGTTGIGIQQRSKTHTEELQAKLLDAEVRIAKNQKDKLINDHTQLRQQINLAIGTLILPNPALFMSQYGNNPREGLIAYRGIISKLFELYRMGRDLIWINNSFQYYSSTKNTLPIELTLNSLKEIQNYFSKVVFPWRASIHTLIKSNGFGPVNTDMAIAITTHFPTNLSFADIV